MYFYVQGSTIHVRNFIFDICWLYIAGGDDTDERDANDKQKWYH